MPGTKPRITLPVLDEGDGRNACCGVVLAPHLSTTEASELARAFAALADPVRLRLLSLIAAAGESCSCDLEAPLGKSQSTVSHHTKALAEAGLITGEKRGRWMWWRVVPERFAALRLALDSSPLPAIGQLAGGQPAARGATSASSAL
jgi:ArsR family transcriptional regulator